MVSAVIVRRVVEARRLESQSPNFRYQHRHSTSPYTHANPEAYHIRGPSQASSNALNQSGLQGHAVSRTPALTASEKNQAFDGMDGLGKEEGSVGKKRKKGFWAKLKCW